MRAEAGFPSIARDIGFDRLFVPLLGIAAFAFHAILLAQTARGFWGPVNSGLTFNDMLAHMLEGRFDVDPAIVGAEGYFRDGRIYAYFGIFCAMLRLPLLLLPDGLVLDVTVPSCALACAIALMGKARALLAVLRACPDSGRARALFLLLMIVAIFGGAQVQFLKASIYQEALLWGYALNCHFIAILVGDVLIARKADTGTLARLALLAGLTLVTRVSMAIAPFAITLWLVAGTYLRGRGAAMRALGPLAILGAFAAIAGFVNLMRWGDPTVFVALDRNISAMSIYTDRIARVHALGAFNPVRIPFGLVYYFLPIWVLPGADGQGLFHDFIARALDAAEFPPSSFLVSDPFLLALGGILCVALVRGRTGLLPAPRRDLAVCLAAFAIAPVLMLMAPTFAYRYRMEFAPLFEYAALMGFLVTATRGGPAAHPARSRWPQILAAIGLVASWVLFAAYASQQYGPVMFRDGKPVTLMSPMPGPYYTRPPAR